MRWLSLVVGILLVPQTEPAGATLTGTITLPEGHVRKKTRLNPKNPDAKLKQLKKDPDPSLPVVYLEGPPSSPVKDRVLKITQEGVEFRPRVLAVQAGTTVRFVNTDLCQHHVFSYSKAKKFNGGYTAQDESFDVVFDIPGKVELRCELHSHMVAYILVVDHPHFTVASEAGKFLMAGLPEGKFTLVAWHEDFDPVRVPVEIKAGQATVDLKLPAE